MPRKYVHTSAIVLKRINYKDANKILTLYTEKLGKVSALAKGIRKMKSRKKSHLELLNYSNVYLVEGKAFYIITQAESIESFPSFKKDLAATQQAYYIGEVFEKLILENEVDTILFQFLLKTLQILDTYPSYNLVNAYNLKLIKLLGYYNKHKMNEYKQNSKDIKQYLDDMERLPYEDIVMIQSSLHTIRKAHLFLRNQTEGILGRNIKTQISLKG